MTTEQSLIAAGLIALVVIVFLLRHKIFKIRLRSDGVEVDNEQPIQRTGVVVGKAVARGGSIKIENYKGDGVEASDLDAAKDVNVTNNPSPKA
jgi:membrane protein implicated in regulation of membrane protease activity